MDRKEYWNKNYVEYFESLVNDANQSGTVSTVSKTTDGDVKAPGDAVLEDLFEKMDSSIGERILDYGCGFGRFYPYFSGGNSDYYGIDISTAMIDACKRRYPHVEKRFLVAEGEKLPFDDSFFDKIICVGVFDACYQESALAEMLRVCRTGGEILITGKGINYLDGDEQALIAEDAARKKEHPNYFTDVSKMLQQLQSIVDVAENRFFLSRGDFGQDRYVREMPENFYEWALILRKTSHTDSIKFESFSDPYSNTWKRLKR